MLFNNKVKPISLLMLETALPHAIKYDGNVLLAILPHDAQWAFASRVYLISRRTRFSRVLFVIVMSEKRSRCRRTYRPVCRDTQWVNLHETRAKDETGKFCTPFDVRHINQKYVISIGR